VYYKNERYISTLTFTFSFYFALTQVLHACLAALYGNRKKQCYNYSNNNVAVKHENTVA